MMHVRTLRPVLGAIILSTLAAVAAAQVEITDPPVTHDFGKIPLNANYAAQYFSVHNRGASPVTLGQAGVDGQVAVCQALGCPAVAPGDFVIAAGSDGCSHQTLEPGHGCSTLLGFVPTLPGGRSARLVFDVPGASPVTRIVSGTGVSDPTDCVLDWAERTYPALISPPASTFVAGPYIARCYQGGTLCVGADAAYPTFAPASVYLYQNGQLTRYASLSDVAAQASYPSPSTRRCSQLPDGS